MMSTRNPIDIIGDADSSRVRQILENIVRVHGEKGIDLLFFFTVQATTDIDMISAVLIDFHEKYPYYFLLVGLIGGETIARSSVILREAGIFVSTSTESLISAYSVRTREMRLQTPLIHTVQHTSRHPDALPILLDQDTTEKILAEHHIMTTCMTECLTLDSVILAMSHIQ